jgi:ADP-heptose:LPS heptosyltransferase
VTGEAPPQVLVYRTLGLGDFLTAVPALRAVRRAFPTYVVVLAVPAAFGPLAALTGAVDQVVATDELAVPNWPWPRPEVAVNLHGRGPASHLALQALAPRRLVAFARPDLGIGGPPWKADEHEVTRWCRLVTSAGMPGAEDDLDLQRPAAPSPRRGAVVVHPGAADPARRWPAQRFAAVAAALHHDHDVVVTGMSSERALAAQVARGAGLPDEAVLAGKLDLAQLAGLVAEARLVVCGDTGVAHLATAYRTPSVLLFGPMSPALWGPPAPRPQHRVLWHPDLASAPRPDHGPHPALLAITVAEVLAACVEGLGGVRADGAAAAGPDARRW